MRKWEGRQKIKKQIYTLSEKVQGIMRVGGEGFVFLMKYNLSEDLKKGSERALWGKGNKNVGQKLACQPEWNKYSETCVCVCVFVLIGVSFLKQMY